MSELTGEIVDAARDTALLMDAGAADRGITLSNPPPDRNGGDGFVITPSTPASIVDPADAAREAVWVALVVDYAPLAGAFLPKACADKLDDDRCRRIGVQLARLAKKRNWPTPDFAASPEAGLVRECFPVAEPVVLPYMAKLWSGGAAAPAPNDGRALGAAGGESDGQLTRAAERQPAGPSASERPAPAAPSVAPNGMTDDEFVRMPPPARPEREASEDAAFKFNMD
jgi:hypothetical protein